MTAEERFCSACRAPLPPKVTECPVCGLYAGDLYDERVHRSRTRFILFGTLLFLAIVAGGAAIWWNTMRALADREQTSTATAPPTRVVRDRPGGARRAKGAVVNEAEAIRLARRHLVVTTGVKSECLALLGAGIRNGAYIVSAHDRCSSTRLGKFRVDGKTGEVTRARADEGSSGR